jgi:uncharacterized protein
MSIILIDTGPIISLLNRKDTHHRWTVDQLKRFPVPLITCDAVLSEAFFILQRTPNGVAQFTSLLERELLISNFSFTHHRSSVLNLMSRYINVPMSFADACLVRMIEINDQAKIFTLDSDFTFYRTSDRKTISCVNPIYDI